MTSPLFEAAGIIKRYPGVCALDGVGLAVESGEVHALLGENGAGKSTLSRICAGIISPDSGQLAISGLPFAPTSRRAAERVGVRMVTQELTLIATLSVAENIFLDRLPRRFGFIDYPRLHAQAAQLLERVGLRDIAPACRVGSLGVGQQQMVEIARGLGGADGCKLLILDEPTASLSRREIDLLFAQIRQLKAAGTSILYISHRMEEIRQISDRLTILRDGRTVGRFATPDISLQGIIRHLVGRDVGEIHHKGRVRGTAALRADRVCAGPLVRDVSFTLHRGEILGLSGLVGSGRTETLRALFAADPLESGQIHVHGAEQPTVLRSPHDAVVQRMAFVTEDRKSQGLLLSQTIAENITLTDLGRTALGGMLCHAGTARRLATTFAERMGVRAYGVDQRVGDLSGGNQQKVVIAKWLFRDADILLFDEPTRGIDIGAKFEIYRLLAALADEGRAILVVSSDMPELISICDRIAVMSAGRLVTTFDRDDFNQEALMAAALSGYHHD